MFARAQETHSKYTFALQALGRGFESRRRDSLGVAQLAEQGTTQQCLQQTLSVLMVQRLGYVVFTHGVRVRFPVRTLRLVSAIQIHHARSVGPRSSVVEQVVFAHRVAGSSPVGVSGYVHNFHSL